MARLPGRCLPALLASCVAGLSCTALIGTPISLPPAAAAATPVTQASGPEKASPYAAAQDDNATPASSGAEAVLEDLGGTRARGSTKDSPFAGAKESDAVTSTQLRVDRRRLWWLLLPLSLAAISWAVLRGQEGETA